MNRIQLVTLMGDRLNIIGDQANLFILQKRLSWLGFASDIVTVKSLEELEASKPDFLLLGRGSIAGWQSALGEWPTLAADFATFTKHTPGLAIGVSAQTVAETSGETFEQLPATYSEFEVEELNGQELLGYKFTTVTNAETRMLGRAILTWMHGPLLAKNPALADQLIVEILAKASIDAPKSFSNENTRKIDEILAGVWQLEKPQK